MGMSPAQRRRVLAAGLVLCVLMVLIASFGEGYTRSDRLLAGAFYGLAAALTCYLLFTAPGRERLSHPRPRRWRDRRTGHLVQGLVIVFVSALSLANLVADWTITRFLLVVLPISGALFWVLLRLLLLTDSARGKRRPRDAVGSAEHEEAGP